MYVVLHGAFHDPFLAAMLSVLHDSFEVLNVLSAEQSYQYRRISVPNAEQAQSRGHGCMLLSVADISARQADLLMHGALHIHVIVMCQAFPEVRCHLCNVHHKLLNDCYSMLSSAYMQQTSTAPGNRVLR